MSLAAPLVIVKTSWYLTQHIGKSLMTLISLPYCLNTHTRRMSNSIINIDAASSVSRVMNLGEMEKARKSTQRRWQLTLRKPFKHIRALRQTSKPMKCFSRDVDAPGEHGKWDPRPSRRPLQVVWGKGLGEEKKKKQLTIFPSGSFWQVKRIKA